MPADDREKLLELIERIYDAALDPNLWPRFVDQLVATADSTTGAIFSLDSNTVTSRFIAHHGLSERAMSDYEAYYAAKDPWNPAMIRAPLGNLFFSHQLTPDRILTRTEFYSDVLKPQGLHYAAGGLFSRVGDTLYCVCVQRSRTRGPYDVKAGMLRHIFGHLDRGIRLQRRLEELESRESAGLSALDHLSTGVILMSGSARVVFMNQAAERAVSAGAGLQVKNTELRAENAEADDILQNLISACVDLKKCTKRNLFPFLSIPRKRERTPLTAFVSPVSNRLPLLNERHMDVRAIVFLQDPEQKTAATLEAIRVLYQLTPTQALLVEKLIQGVSLEDAAKDLGVSKETSRTHLKNVFKKTGTRRQSELVKLISTGISASIRVRD